MREVYKVEVEEDEESCSCSGLGSRVEISGAKGRRHLAIIIEPLHLLPNFTFWTAEHSSLKMVITSALLERYMIQKVLRFFTSDASPQLL